MVNRGIKEITVYSIGNSSDIATWSNVPYFFTRSLVEKGVKVNRVDLGHSHIGGLIYDKSIRSLWKKCNEYTSYDYFRTWLNYFHQQIKIRHAIRKYKNSDIHLFLTFSFLAKRETGKSLYVQFGDWTYDYYLKFLHNASGDILERSGVKREIKQIRKADGLFCLFPGAYEYIRKLYRKKEVYYLGNVINSCYTPEIGEIKDLKRDSKVLLFIGNQKYKKGAQLLINACKHEMIQNENVSIHIIGIDKKELGDIGENVFCHGYLNKGIEHEREKYYTLIKKARVVINTTPIWAGFSSMIEAMYFYTPVIVYPYDEFKRTFGEDISFGIFCNNSGHSLMRAILDMLNSNNYNTLCESAHEAVKEFSWSRFCDKFLQISQALLEKKYEGKTNRKKHLLK